jgi:molecular chaperone DnaK (HSP70)
MPANNSNTPLIGIDFGTTKTMAACFDQSKGQTILLKLGLRGYEIPTSIYQTAEGRTFYGEEADDEGVSDHINYIHRFKMKLGQPGPAHFGRMTRTAEQLASDFLSHVRATLKSEVLHSKEDSDLERAVLTIPAIFGRAQQNELKRAAETAGFTQVVLLQEPVAAGIAYCDHHAVKGSLRFLVVDWGGGTFDVALMEREEDGSIRIIPEFVGGLDGINHGDNIGGEFMDDLLFQATSHALTTAGFQGLDRQDPMMWGKYKRDITRAKERLSSREEVDIPFVLDGGTPAKVKFERSTLEGKLNETVMTGARFVEGLLQRCRDGGCPPEFILLAGGTSRMPMVKRVFEETLKIDCRTWTQGREAIALGAAIKARDLWISTETKKPKKPKNTKAESLAAANEAERLAATDRKAAADKAKRKAAAAAADGEPKPEPKPGEPKKVSERLVGCGEGLLGCGCLIILLFVVWWILGLLGLLNRY